MKFIRHHKIKSYKPESSVEWYVKKFMRELFDTYDLHESYDINHCTEKVLSALPSLSPKRTSILNRTLAAAAIWRVCSICGNYPKDNIPMFTQLQIRDTCGVSDLSIRRASQYIESVIKSDVSNAYSVDVTITDLKSDVSEVI